VSNTGPTAFHQELDLGVRQRGAELNTTINIKTHWNPYGLNIELWAVVKPAPGYHEPQKVALHHLVTPRAMDSVPAEALVRPILDEFEQGLRNTRLMVAGL
jgi:hypothetical protein